MARQSSARAAVRPITGRQSVAEGIAPSAAMAMLTGQCSVGKCLMQTRYVCSAMMRTQPSQTTTRTPAKSSYVWAWTLTTLSTDGACVSRVITDGRPANLADECRVLDGSIRECTRETGTPLIGWAPFQGRPSLLPLLSS